MFHDRLTAPNGIYGLAENPAKPYSNDYVQ